MKNKIDNSDLVESKLYDYWNENTETLCGYATARLFGQKVEYETLQSVLSQKIIIKLWVTWTTQTPQENLNQH